MTIWDHASLWVFGAALLLWVFVIAGCESELPQKRFTVREPVQVKVEISGRPAVLTLHTGNVISVYAEEQKAFRLAKGGE